MAKELLYDFRVPIQLRDPHAAHDVRRFKCRTEPEARAFNTMFLVFVVVWITMALGVSSLSFGSDIFCPSSSSEETETLTL